MKLFRWLFGPPLEEFILAALTHRSDLSARNIQIDVGEMRGGREPLSGNLYPVLLKLELRGEVISRWRDGAYPRQRLYSLKSEESTPALPPLKLR